jgi:hypothetical protein
MSVLNWLFGGHKKTRRPSRASTSQPFQASTQFVASQNSRNPGASALADRKELLRIVLRETLTRNGIPLPWVGADALAATSSGRAAGVHIRLLIKHWDPRLALHGVAFQQDFEKRLLTLDPLAPTWLMGISWQYTLPNNSVCPPLPHPDAWLDAPDEPAVALAALVAARPATGGSADVIAGPVRIAETIAPIATRKPGEVSADARADLERLLAVRDADMQGHAGSGNFAPTEPAPL